ncbi:methionine metabolism [Spathaspora passalidarum NRRL Y-27907]|uniref:Methionine metabolism n=1 Tax=Spathaspora passalidarum (strain NRRL Y-27907 / 11-Y1) TaxID=619300 RepID=G3AMB5_SPAPN|nr:methionine metabolism [Spathaspora passalidarum NRRL Y-27907]EGW33413.1 methionine metabolism [Spathaspora passalidarum NRRL Y-27907]
MPSLLASLISTGETHLVIGYSNVASIRITSIIESGASPILITNKGTIFTPSVQQYQEDGKLEIIYDDLKIDNIRNSLKTLGREEVDGIVDRVFVSLPSGCHLLKKQIFETCKKLRIPINTSDSPEFCTFTLLASYTSGDFQMGVTTSGKGCRLASRIKRELANSLPPDIGAICNKIGELRKAIQKEDQLQLESIGEHDDDAVNSHKFNTFVPEFNASEEHLKLQRTRWLAQIVEYYPLKKLATLSITDLTNAYHDHKENPTPTKKQKLSRKGQLTLVGSGPGSVSLLTLGALQAIHTADLVLADKLVPQQVLDIIPRKTELFIARKFPGNAEKAQEELLSLGITALNEGKNVIRLKQGDPYIFGRGGEEFNYFKDQGFTPTVIPGITSALAAPVLSNIPATHRDVADQVLICTGTGRRGAIPTLPEFIKSRTTVFLMTLHRVVEFIPKLIEQKGWDPKLPVAIIERASCPDQRVIRTTLSKVADAVEACGSRPPGLLVTGYACEVIFKNEDAKEWTVEEGCNVDFDETFDSIVKLVGSSASPEPVAPVHVTPQITV